MSVWLCRDSDGFAYVFITPEPPVWVTVDSDGSGTFARPDRSPKKIEVIPRQIAEAFGVQPGECYGLRIGECLRKASDVYF